MLKIGTVITILEDNWQELYAPLLKAGFDYFELLPENQEVYSLPEIKKFFAHHEVILHAPFTSLNLLSSSELIRQASYKHLKNVLSPLREHFHPNVITLHLGSVPFFNQTYNFDYAEKLYTLFPELAVENMPLKTNIWNMIYPSNETDLKYLLKNSKFNLTFDVGHWAKQGLDVYSFIELYGKRMKHIHIHDTVNGKDHQVLGTGTLKLKKFLNALYAIDYAGYVSIELASDNVDGAIRSLEVLRRTII